MAKANFDDIYTAPDPRPYFQTLGALDYRIPAHGSAVFAAVAEQVAQVRDRDTVRIADLCCSYGINAAALKHDASFDEIVEHYTAEECEDLDRHALLARDRAFFGTADNQPAIEVVGIDASAPAVSYAIDAGFLDAGAAENLEAHEPSPALVDLLEPTDLVTVTGGIGYITERTIGRVLDAGPTQPWLAAMCLRWIDFDPIAEAAQDRDMVVHHLEGVTFPQRRFADDHEQHHVLEELDRIGVDPSGVETDGYHHAELYVVHPADEALPAPLQEIIPAATAGV